MLITDVRIRKVNYGRTRAYASLTIDDAFAVHDIKVIEGDNGLFIAMPSRRRTDGTFADVAHPINQETRELICTAVIEAYNNSDSEVV